MEETSRISYQRKVGSILFAAILTRPDIVFAAIYCVTIVNRHRFPLLLMFFSCSFQNVFQYSNIFSSPFTGSIPKLKNMVPAKKLGTENFEQLFRIAQKYKLGNQTEKMLADKGSDLRKRAKPILTKYATTSEGGYCARSDLGLSRQSDFVYRVAPWLLHYGGRFSF